MLFGVAKGTMRWSYHLLLPPQFQSPHWPTPEGTPLYISLNMKMLSLFLPKKKKSGSFCFSLSPPRSRVYVAGSAGSHATRQRGVIPACKVTHKYMHRHMYIFIYISTYTPFSIHESFLVRPIALFRVSTCKYIFTHLHNNAAVHGITCIRTRLIIHSPAHVVLCCCSMLS